jgi:DNA recombination protein RmuC
MEVLLIVLVVLVLVVNAGVLFFLFSRQQAPLTDNSASINERIAELARTMHERLDRSTATVQDSMRTQMSESFKLIRDVTEGLTKLDETNRQVVSFADQLQSLQSVLQNPKQRGVLGEYFLESVLQDVLPEGTYQVQYPFKNGEIVDAIVKVNKHIVPIDAKFSLENFNRMMQQNEPTERMRLEKLFINDLKIRIKETSKYIRPEEGTTDFAFMFIPSEGIYYDLLSNKINGDEDVNLLQRAYTEYKVIIVSPTTFLAYLQTVIQGLKSLKIEEKVQDVIKNVEDLTKHLGAYREYQSKLGNALGTVVNHYNASEKEFKKIDKDVLKITGEAIGVEIALIDGPEKDS